MEPTFKHAPLLDEFLSLITNSSKLGFCLKEIEVSEGMLRELVRGEPGFRPEVVYFNGPDGKVLICTRKEDGSGAS